MRFQNLKIPRPLSDHPYVVVDVETTGLDANIDRVVEVAAIRFQAGRALDRVASLVDPGIPIPPAASEQHHLVDADLVGAPAMEEVEAALDALIGPGDIVFAHNAKFDSAFLPSLGNRTWVCSQRAARHLWPDLPSYRNQYLRYHHGLDQRDLKGIAAHRAQGDVLVTGFLVHRELKAFEVLHPDAGMEDFLRFVAAPIPISIMPFGKAHRGKPMCDVPSSYFDWMLMNVADLDPDLRAAVITELEQRNGVTVAA